MARGLVKVQWDKPSHALPAFLTVMIMPLTYSIAYGLIAGIMIFYIMEGTYFILSKFGIKNPSCDEEPAVVKEVSEEEVVEKDVEAEEPAKEEA